MDSATLGRAARGLAPQIMAAREAVERERELPAALVEALGAAGMFALWLPKSLGGPELDAPDYVQVIEELSRLDGSVGWCASVASAYSAIAGHLPPDVAHRIYSGGRTVVAGAVKPNGKAFVADGGYRVTGHWTFGSGITHSSWTLGGCVVHDGNGPRKDPDGEPEVRLVLFPTTAAEVIDTWRVSGLRGTGSHDYRVADVFVPESYTIPYPPQPAVRGGVLYAVPLISVLSLAIAAVPLGIARAAIDEVTVLATAKVPQGSRTLLRDKPTVQAAVARAEALLGSARCYLIRTAGRLWDEAARGPVSLRQRALVRLACTHAAQASAEATDLMYDVAGGSAIYEAGHLERCFRDVHACTQHIATATSNFEMVGRVLFGLDPEMPRV